MRRGYRYVSRAFSQEDFVSIKGTTARPFLGRELLNVPKIPFSCSEFLTRCERSENEEALFGYYGMLVEWEAKFSSYRRNADGSILAFLKGQDTQMLSIMMELPGFMYDVVRLFSKGDTLWFRGIICGINSLTVDLNYVDIQISDPNPALES